MLAVDDYGIRKGFAEIHKLAELPKPKRESAGLWGGDGVPIAASPVGRSVAGR